MGLKPNSLDLSSFSASVADSSKCLSNEVIPRRKTPPLLDSSVGTPRDRTVRYYIRPSLGGRRDSTSRTLTVHIQNSYCSLQFELIKGNEV